MCEPATLAAASLALGAIGTGVSTVGALSSASAQKQQADYQAQVARNNAQVAANNAQAVRDQAMAKAVDDERLSSMRLSAQRAALGASGVTLDSGSALDVQSATAQAGALGSARDLYQGQLAAYGYETQGANYTAQAGLDTMAGENAQSAGYMSAASSFLGGASQVSSKWAAYQQGNYGGGLPAPSSAWTGQRSS